MYYIANYVFQTEVHSNALNPVAFMGVHKSSERLGEKCGYVKVKVNVKVNGERCSLLNFYDQFFNA